MKIKKVLGVLVAACMLLAMLPVVSSAASAGDTFTAGDFTYTVNTDTSTVTLTAIATASLSGAVTVPSTVSDGMSNYTVTKLGAAFKNQGTKTDSMTSLTLPDTITAFTVSATFYGCKFTSVHLPSALTAGDAANQLTNTFMYCNNLTSVVLPAGITKCYGTFRNSGVRTVAISGTAQVDFYGSSGTTDARAWVDGITGITIYYPANGTAPTRTGTSFTATVSKLGTQGTAFRHGDFVYTINSTTSTVTLTSISAAVSALPTDVTVPATVTDPLGGSYTVTQLGDAFKDHESITTSMTSLTLPDTITKFTGTATFYACKGLTSIHLPANLTGDGNAAGTGYLTTTFRYCNNLSAVTLPAGITKCYGTFRNSAVRTVTITGRSQVDFYGSSGTSDARAWVDGVTGITIKYPEFGTAPYRTGTSFTATVSTYSVTFTAGDFNYKVTGSTAATLTGVAAGSLSGAVTVPSTVTNANDTYTYTVTAIGGQAFNGKSAVTALTLPNTVTTLGYQAFMEMDGLTSFTMPDSVTSIGYGLFYGCNNLADVKLSKNLTGTMQTTFAYCPSLTGCVIPSGVTTLNKTFMYCNIIKTVFVPASVTTITGDDASDIRSRLFSTFNTNGTITGAPTEPGFIVMGTSGSAIDTYITGKGWNFKAVDNNMELALSDPVPHVNQTVTVEVVNFKNTDETTQKIVFSAYYDKTTGEMTDVGFETLGTVDAVDLEPVTVTMQTGYNASNVLARAFAWAVGTLAPLADYSELNEVQ